MGIGDISVGAIGAAVIGAGISLIGLIISKESKVSEFRQNWINDLRAEMVRFSVGINAISDAIRGSYGDYNSKRVVLAPLYSDLNHAVFSINLRLNSEEGRSKRVILAANKLLILSADEANFTSDKIRPIEREYTLACAELLKFEWGRVKRGEPTFRAVKWLSVLALGVFSAILALSAFGLLPSSQGTSTDNAAGDVPDAAKTGTFTSAVSAPSERQPALQLGPGANAKAESPGGTDGNPTDEVPN